MAGRTEAMLYTPTQKKRRKPNRWLQIFTVSLDRMKRLHRESKTTWKAWLTWKYVTLVPKSFAWVKSTISSTQLAGFQLLALMILILMCILNILTCQWQHTVHTQKPVVPTEFLHICFEAWIYPRVVAEPWISSERKTHVSFGDGSAGINSSSFWDDRWPWRFVTIQLNQGGQMCGLRRSRRRSRMGAILAQLGLQAAPG